MLLLGWILAVLIRLVVATPSQTYADLYTTVLSPIGLYDPTAPILAPLRPPWRGDNDPALLLYRRELYLHDAYIDTYAGHHLDALRREALSLPQNTDHPRLAEKQRALLAGIEQAAEQAKWEMRTALHPSNVRAQHSEALISLDERLRKFLSNSVSDNLWRISSLLEPAEVQRLVAANSVFLLERFFIQSAMPLANTLPHNIRP